LLFKFWSPPLFSGPRQAWRAMSKDIVVRLVSPAGRSRITLPPTSAFSELQEKVKAAVGVEPGAQRFALDDKGQRPVGGAPSASLATLGIVNGTQLFLTNSEATIAAQVLTKVPVPVEPEKPVSKAGGENGDSKAASSSSTPAPAAANSSSSSAVSADAPPPGNPGNDKVDRKAKFEVFDTFLRTRRYDTTGLPGSQVYKSAQLKAGGMIKLPGAVSIKQQLYRHVDQVSFINDADITDFVNFWNSEMLPNAVQRVGWLYGYYLEDANYGDKYYTEGTRAVVEGIYEPPQQMIGGDSVLQADPDLPTVNKIAEALGLECVGFIFTSLPLDDELLISPNEVLRMARQQNEYSTDVHFTKYRLSKFITCAVRPDPEQEGRPGLNSFMVSDQCAAMVRDGILCENSDPKNSVVREAAKGELIPNFLVEGKVNRCIPTDFFVVRLVDAQPKKRISMFKHSDFPRENRPLRPQQRNDLKKYFGKRDKSEASWSRFADFHLILYIAKEFDPDTALQICESVREQTDVPEGTRMIMDELTR